MLGNSLRCLYAVSQPPITRHTAAHEPINPDFLYTPRKVFEQMMQGFMVQELCRDTRNQNGVSLSRFGMGWLDHVHLPRGDEMRHFFLDVI